MSRNIDQYAKDYLEHDFERTLVAYRRKKVLEILSSFKPLHILEVGCGLDPLFNYYRDFDSYVVVEPSALFCEQIEGSEGIADNIEIVNDFLENSLDRLIEKQFDCILVCCLLHEVPDIDVFLASIRSLCSSNTFLHISVPNSRAFHLLWAYESGLIPQLGQLTSTATKLQQNTIFDIFSLIKVVEQAGFEIIDQGSYFIKPFNHAKMTDCMNVGILNPLLLDGLYKMIHYMPDLGCEVFVNMRYRS